MLSILRRLTQTRIGLIVTFAALILIAIAFSAGGMGGFGGGGGGLKPTIVAQVGNTAISEENFKTELQNQLSAARQQQPSLDMNQFIEGGGFEGVLGRMINTIALQQFGAKQGMVISKKLVDGQIASIPALQGPDGKFDPAIYKQLLEQQHLTDAGLRHEMAQDLMAQQLTSATESASQVPEQLALPYASLLLEKRQGQIGFVPTRAMGAGAKPTDKELAAYYKAHIAKYTVPERRVIRYALVTPDTVKAKATPSAAQIAQAYKAQHARFEPREERTIEQVIVASKDGAAALAKKVAGGTSIDAAAKAAGLDASTITDVSKADFTKQSSADTANAAFSAKSGAVVGPLKGPLGWAILKVKKITQVPGKSLAQAHDILAKELMATRTNQLLGSVHDTLDDAITSDATFDEVVKSQGLKAQATPPVTSAGVDPEDPSSQPNPAMAQVIEAGFDAQPGDSPQMAPVGKEGAFAVVSLDKIVPAAPRPLARIHDMVVQDFTTDRADAAAHKIAADIVAKVDKGTAMAAAFRQAKAPLPPVQPVKASRAQLAANPQGAPPPLALMFSMAEKHAKLLAAPHNAGWLVVYLDNIDRVDASGNAGVINATRSDLGHFVGREYAQEFATAVSREIGVKKNASAIAEVRKQLTGDGADAP